MCGWVQKYDWMKHLTDAEMQQMKADNWDVEDVELGPITERYLQPSLQFDAEEYARVISQGREASRLVDLYNNGGKVLSRLIFILTFGPLKQNQVWQAA